MMREIATKPSALAGAAPSRAKFAFNWGLLVAVAALMVVLLLPTPAALPIAGHRTLAILAFAIVVWMTEALDNAVSGVVIAALLTFSLGLSPDPANPKVLLGTGRALSIAFAGFSNPALVLVAAALFLAAAMTTTQLDKRIALSVLARAGTRTDAVVVGSMLVGIVLAFMVPSTTARVSCLVPIMMGIIAAYGVDKKSAFAGMLLITTAQTASIWNVGIKTAAAQNLVAIGFIERQLGQTITWIEWLIAAAPFTIIMTVALYCFVMWVLPPETREIAGGREAVKAWLDELRPISPAQIKLLTISICLIGFWATEGVLHAFDTSSTTLAAVALLFLPGVAVMSWKQAQSQIPWGTIVLFGVGISLGTALLTTKGATWLADIVVVQFALKQASAFFILAVLGLFLTVVHLGFASATALASAMIPIVVAVLQNVATPGINLVGMTMLLQFVVSFGFILVVNAPQNMVAYGTDTFEARDFVKVGLVMTVIAYGLVLLLGMTYWKWLGYV
jgi:solute carrier family 13 (sodium-dependent dicarboxylate transporter), member 2/3/5